jgi:hypothetical protein
MSRCALIVLALALLAGFPSRPQDEDRGSIFPDDPTKGPEFRNEQNRRKYIEALTNSRDARVYFFVPVGEKHSFPIPQGKPIWWKTEAITASIKGWTEAPGQPGEWCEWYFRGRNEGKARYTFLRPVAKVLDCLLSPGGECAAVPAVGRPDAVARKRTRSDPAAARRVPAGA